jgi:hypothetical protein
MAPRLKRPIDTRLRAAGFHPAKKSFDPETQCACQAYKRCVARQCRRQNIAMNATLSAALIGAVIGYLIARHIAEIEWLLRTLIG